MTGGHSDSDATLGNQPLVSVAFPNQSTTLRVLLLPELVESFLGFLDRADNTRNARVCKTWCDIALKIIWAEADDLCALFSILAPSTVSARDGGGNFQSFTRLPYVSDWHRFDKHARLVRKLALKYIDTGEESKPGVSRSLLRDISQTRIRLQIFPNLQALEWVPRHRYHSDNPDPGDAILFMHEGVKQFSIYLPKYMRPWQIEQLSLDIPLRMPRLTVISINTVINTIKLEKPLSSLVSNLRALESITIPSQYLTNRLTDLLSSLPALTSLASGWGTGNAALLEHAQLGTQMQRFKVLQDLFVKAPLDRVTHLLKAGISSTDLRMLSVYPQSGPASDIQQMLELCAEKHEGVTILGIEFDQEIAPVGNPLPPITFAALRSLGDWSNLSDLRIVHPASLSLSFEEITTIVSAHKCLSRLVLNPSPVHCESSALGLDILPVIARHGRNLVELGLFLDSTKPVSPPCLEAISHAVLFPKLTSCSLGVSVITKESCRPAAAYLSKCLPGACKIEYGAEWATDPTDGDVDDPHVRIAHERSGLWKEVEGLLQFLEMVRMQERTC